MSGAIVVMARAPRPGCCKTRLEPLLGTEGCARLQAELIRTALATASAAGPATVLAFDPPEAGPELDPLVPSHAELLAQDEGSLGERLTHAAAFAFERFGGPVTLVGTDAPLLTPRHLATVHDALGDGVDACLVPAYDGGYALLALTRRVDAAFALPHEAWGGPEVRALTISALRHAGLRIGLLEPIDDLDTPDDARRLARHPACPPAIRAILEPYLAVAA